ncbi:arsenite methyltransferase [Streptomyces aidingensis]|uniref:Arsenite methyltransferase n=1 Tax=Streptomyces aidingensis TaxID=910347 RepID=A0A1I1PZU2_9ACTN|nr:arsenite methyltransferase [Streptomyces aidingensis]SFD15421.1 Methyltransferase domain-containing protein [Streptomyces aidingensis]
MSEQSRPEELREDVRRHYADAALAVTRNAGRACCGPQGTEAAADVAVDEDFGSALYSADERGGLPAEAVAASLGCGNPTAVADLHEGERVLDLGSGGGIDVLLSARRVGPTGRAYGLDMTDEMLALALANARRAGAANVEFLKGVIEAIPLPAGTVDVVISNCVINLSTDKPAVFAEMFRVLAPGGRIGVSDIVADDGLSPGERAERGSYVGCVAGALTFQEYRAGLAAAGFTGISLTPTHQVAEGMHSVVVRATKPAGTTGTHDPAETAGAAAVASGGCC